MEKAKLKSVSDLLKHSWDQYKKYYEILVPIMLIAGVGMYLQTLFLFLASNGRSVDGMFALLALLSSILYLIGMIWGGAALLNVVHKVDQPVTVKQAFMNAKPLIWPLFITGLLAGIFTLLGLIALFIGAIVVGVYLSFAFYIVVNENKSGMAALKASKNYVDGYWWPVFGRLIVIGLVIGAISWVIGAVVNAIFGYSFGMLLQNIASLALTPLAVLYQYDLYLNVKSVKGGAHATPVTPAPVATPAA